MWIKVKKWILKYDILIIIIVSALSRLPQILSNNLFLDGDESIVGLMSKHFIEGKTIPVFFYGQSYGFSLFEVIPIGMSYSIFGITDIAIKVAMLCLWILGIIFFYKTLKEIGHKKNLWSALLIALVFILLPSFALWSMKARGGYLTAFLLSSIIMYFAFHKKWQESLFLSFISGLFLTIIYQSQALWLAGLIPLLAFSYLKKQKQYPLMLLSGTVFGTLIFYVLKSKLSTFWSPSVFSWSNLTMEKIASIPKEIYINMTGSYHYSFIVEPAHISKVLAIISTSMIFSVLIIAIIILIKKKKINPLFFIACLSVFLTIVYQVFTPGHIYRYLLPLSGYSLLMLYMLIINLDKKKVANVFLALFIVLGAFSMYSFKEYSFSSKSKLNNLIDDLQSKNINHIYCEGVLLQWKIMFYSNENVIARCKSNIDRYPDYIKEVDNAFEHEGINTALVGFYNKKLVKISNKFVLVSNKYFVYENPSKDLLIERDFNLDKLDANK